MWKRLVDHELTSEFEMVREDRKMKRETIKYKTTAAVFLGFFILLLTGWFVLMGSFDFPEILRKSAVERFALFEKNQSIIVPAYYVMSITAILQVYMAVMMYQLTRKGHMIDLVALISGVLAGIFQILGFFRWVILIPMLSTSLNSKEISPEVIFFLEKFANTYFGMTVGEHLGTFFLALWLISIGVIMMKSASFNIKLSILGVVSGVALLIASYENISGVFSFLGTFTAGLWGFYLVWVLIMAITLFLTKEKDLAPKIHWSVWLLGAIFYLANAVPPLL